jgi:putative ABC transport system permease protein
VNGLFLRPPPYDHHEELVGVWGGMPDEIPDSDTSWREFEGLQGVDGAFVDVGAFDGAFAGLKDTQGTRSAFVESMTPNLFPLLGIEPVLGRSFLPDESSDPAGNPLAILGYRYWIDSYDGDRSVLGGTIHISGIPHTVVGVAPPELSALQTRTIVTDVFVPMSMARFMTGRRGPGGEPLSAAPSVKILARLAPGVSLEAAEARISGVVREVRAAQGLTTRDGWGFRLWPLQGQAIEPEIDAGLAKVAAFLMAVAGLVLLLACTNLANLFLARGVSREKELAMRLALGSGRPRLVAQLLTETLLLAALGGLGGFFLAEWTLDLLFRFQPDIGVTFALDTAPDLWVLLFTMGMVAAASFLFGLIPALAVTRSEITAVLKGVGGTRRGRGLRLRGGMVAFQMAVSIILLTGSSLFFHSFLVARNTDPGFLPENALSIQVDMGMSGVPEADWARLGKEVGLRVGSELGVQAMGVADVLPLLNRETIDVNLPGEEPAEGERRPRVNRFRVDDGYLDAMGIPLLSGRGIQESDVDGAELVVLVSQSAVRRFWPDESPLGREIIAGDKSYRVVGVVGEVKVEFLSDPPEPTLYFSVSQWPTPELYLVVRRAGEMGGLVTGLRRALLEIDPDMLVMQVQALEERVGINLYPIRLAAAYLGTFGIMALLLAAIGLYGVVSLSVSRRTREVGIRMSIGADAGSVVAMVLRGSLRSVAIGAVIGLVLAIGLAKLIQSFLFGVEAADPATLVAVPLVLGSVAVLAAFIPARRASRVDPVEALRTE